MGNKFVRPTFSLAFKEIILSSFIIIAVVHIHGLGHGVGLGQVAYAMEQGVVHQAKIRRVVDQKLKCIAYYDQDKKIIKVEISDPKSQIKELSERELDSRPYYEDLFRNAVNIKGHSGQDLISTPWFIYYRDGSKFEWRNTWRAFPLDQNSTITMDYDGYGRQIKKIKYSELGISLDPTKHSTFAIPNLINKGVSLELIQKYFPPKGNESYVPENIIQDFLLECLNNGKNAQHIFDSIENFSSPLLGKRKLGEELKISNFPLASTLIKLIKKDMVPNWLDVSLEIASRVESSSNVNQQLCSITRLAIEQFLQEFGPDFNKAQDLLTHFFAKYPKELKNALNLQNIPYHYYFAQYFLQDKSDQSQRNMAIDFLRLVKNNDRDDNHSQINFYQLAVNEITKLFSYEVHGQYKAACTKEDKCCILKDYLTKIDKSDRIEFPQDLINGNVGALALGDGMEFDFPIDTKDRETCNNLLFYLAKQHSELNPQIEDVEVEQNPNCSIVEDMSLILVEISELTQKLQDKLNSGVE